MAYPLLLDWYDANRRVLPFRGTRDPYAVWISEIMLQQTRTDTVSGYYTRFLNRFPNIAALAQADEQEVLKYWEGLGYYSRARNLHKAAQIMQREYGGRFLVEMPYRADYQRKLQTLRLAVEKLETNQTGTIQLLQEDRYAANFIPGNR